MKMLNINESVYITSHGFSKNHAMYPRCMVFQGVRYNFVDAGIRLTVRKNNSLVEIFTLSDGYRTFRLRSNDNGMNWILLGISE